ncbi:SUMF1/EgtB/PvdO family nonheme iron enzyme [Oscillatoria sp. FACHB-1407]|uniref:formylglycine-generating enzyme family protein n=1 Tax=Oscillatoria sp. FACHB-1407 TaxID=2692847 RepID=UPI001688B345|nr:SUMF1/EgtB/PvdO family nonheme iron enzyme [Oscillatoria sp. FACHB-1407]MBD2462513.1 SUMF1/EgtB/PvdO family nonheme iron enzyme [Oscillatoria sp. FACHB-1407]
MSMLSQLRSLPTKRKRIQFFGTILATALLIISCGTNVSTVVPSPAADPGEMQSSPSGAVAVSPSASPSSMVRIPAGTYTIGSDAAEDTQPVHQVAIAAFQIDRYEVTNAQYAEFLNSLEIQPLQNAAAGEIRSSDLPESVAPLFIEGAEGNQQNPLIALDDEHTRIAIQNGQFVAESGYADHPIAETTWRGAKEFCQWRGSRLPTEVEWEAAARGLQGRTYPWGDEPPTRDRAVYGRNSGATEAIGTHTAGATPEGVHDLAGNLAEWTSTLYRPYPYNPDDGREQPDAVGERVTRGGDHVFDSSPNELTTYFRTGFSREPDRGHRHIGFRCAQSLT